MEQHVITLFHRSIEAKMQVGEQLAPLIAEASEMIVHALVGNNKILLCGNGSSSAIAQVFSANLINRFEQERPGLPALTLGTDATSLSAIADVASYSDVYAKQVRALGVPGDILVIISTSGKPGNLIQAVQAAHDRDMSVIALTGCDGGDISALLDVNDIELQVPLDSRPRIHEVHMLSVFCLCDLIDQQLFGVSPAYD
ncbi:MAG: SIS domain-containing protein [Cellvibrionaceae bacterium]|nr:SIS domain-containing protein [Cellvibrionaceae bacterium]